MKYEFPSVTQNYRYLQSNRSDVLGNIWSSFNLDFQSNLGTLRLGKKLVTNTTSDDDSDLGLPVAFEYFDARWWSICGTKVFKTSNLDLTTSFAVDTSTGYQTNYSILYSDLAIFNNRLWSTTATTLYSKASDGSGTGTWTSRDTLGTSKVHKLAYLKSTNKLYFVDDYATISSIDSSDVLYNSAGDYYIDLGSTESQIATIVANDTSIFIAVRKNTGNSSTSGTQTIILEWDGISSQAFKTFKIESAGILSMSVINNVIYAITAEGILLENTGYSFREIGRLPIKNILPNGSTFESTDGWAIHTNGMIGTKDNTILVNVNNLNYDSGLTINENMPCGIWEFDLSTKNFTHKHSFTLKARSSSTVTDFGQNKIKRIGAIKLNTFSTNSSNGRSTIFAGCGYFSDASTAKYGIFIDSPYSASTDNEGQKRGYFVTNWINATDIDENWGTLWVVHKKFLDATDKIIFKYRLEEETPTYATITWVNTTSFTTTTDITAYDPSATDYDGTYGGEVEVIQGTGSGSCSHITNISENAGTYTVTIDNAVTGVTTGTAKARFQKWIKLLDEVTSQSINYSSMPIDKNNTRIQIKGEFEFTGDNEFHKMILATTPSIIIKN